MGYILETLIFGGACALAALVLSLVLTRCCIAVLPRLKMVDEPRGRHEHAHPVPVGGGIAIIITFCLVICGYCYLRTGLDFASGEFLLVRRLSIPVLAILILGVLDDRFELRSWPKLLVHVAIGLYLYFNGVCISSLFGAALSTWLSLPLTVLWVAGIINAFNLIDGMDGVAAGLASISSLSLALWLLICHESELPVVCMLTFCGACLGFLRYNFAPAKIFMGDTGSMFIGLIFAYFSIQATGEKATITSLLVPVLAMGIPMFDVLLAILRRTLRKYVLKESGVDIMTGDSDHLHHRIQKQMKDQRKTAYMLYLLAGMLVLGAIGATLVFDLFRTLSLAVLGILIFVIMRYATIERFDAANLLVKGMRTPRRSFILTALHPVVDVCLLAGAYLLAAYVLDKAVSFDLYRLEQAICYIAPFPVVLIFSGIYRTYWLRPSISRYYKFFLAFLLAAVIALACALGFILLNEEAIPLEDRIVSMREFFLMYVLTGGVLIFTERFLLHYFESFGFNRLALSAASSRSELPAAVIFGGGLNCRIFLQLEQCSDAAATPVRTIAGIIDDDPALRHLNVYGLNVLGTSDELEELHSKYAFREIIITSNGVPEGTQDYLETFSARHHIKLLRFRHTLTPVLKDNENA